MTTISIINLKGGVGKSVSAINIAHILATVYNKRVLLIDNDKQGNTSKFFGLYNYDYKTIGDLLTSKNITIEQVIKNTKYINLQVIPSNMDLIMHNKLLLADSAILKEQRLKRTLSPITNYYNYCIIDHAPDFNMSVINGLVATDDVLVPVKIDSFGFDGLEHIVEQVNDVKCLNDKISLMGCFITMYQKNNVNIQGNSFFKQSKRYPLFNTHIRKTVKVDEMTFAKLPLLDYAPKCTATLDYLKLVEEYLQKKDG